MPLMEQDLGYSKQQLGWLTAAALAAYGVGQAINGNWRWLGGRLMVALGAIGSMVLCWVVQLHGRRTVAGGGLGCQRLRAEHGLGARRTADLGCGGRASGAGWRFGLYMLSAGTATVLVWCTSDVVLSLFERMRSRRAGDGCFALPLSALGVAGVAVLSAGARSARRRRTAAARRRPPAAVPAPPCTPAPTPTWLQRYRAVLGNPGFLLAAVVIVFQSFARYGLLTWSAAYYSDAGHEHQRRLEAHARAAVGMGLGAVLGGYFSDRWFVTRRGAVVAVVLWLCAGCFLVMRANPVPLDGDQRLGHGPLVSGRILRLRCPGTAVGDVSRPGRQTRIPARPLD